MTFLENLVDRDKSLEGLDFISENRLAGRRPRQLLPPIPGSLDLHLHPGPEGLGRTVVPCVDDAASYMLSLRRGLVGVCRLLDVDCQLLIGP